MSKFKDNFSSESFYPDSNYYLDQENSPKVDPITEDQKIEKIAAVAVNITKVLVIIYLGFVEVFKICKLLVENLDNEFDISRKWATQNYSILKKRLAEGKVASVIEN